MPPRKKSPPKKQHQQSVKDLLHKKQGKNVQKLQKQAATAEKEDDDTIHLPDYFAKHTEILPIPDTKENRLGDQLYHCSTMARVWFRQHSNLDEIIQALVKSLTVNKHPIESYVSAVIRAVTSAPLRKNSEPHSRFRFDSPANEIIGRTLLTNPRMRTQQDFDEFLKFQNKHQLKLLEVPMYVNNVPHEDAKKYVAQKPSAIFLESRLFHCIKRQYYEREDLVVDVYIRNVSLEQLEGISNFKSICLELMTENATPEEEYNTFADILLKSFKSVPGASLIHPQFIVDPRYNLICNIITLEQQHAIADNYRYFYDRTNAGKIHKRLGDGSTRQEFHERYRSREDDDRKLPPFHNLYYQKGDDEEEENPVPLMTREIFVRNDELPAVVIPLDDQMSNETSRDTIVTQAPIPSHVQQVALPETYFKDPKPTSEELELMKLLTPDKRFVHQVKKNLNASFKKDFDALWSKHKQFILMNFIQKLWKDDLDQLLTFVDVCYADSKVKAREFIESHRQIIQNPPHQREKEYEIGK
jgi:hypothetical protein